MSDATIPPNGPDRDLLIAALALRLDFVGQNDLRVAMQAWSADRRRPLSRVLVEAKALAARRVPLIEQLAEECVAQHAGDASLALAALCAGRAEPLDLDGFAPPSTLAGCPATLSGPAIPGLPEGPTLPPQRRFRHIRPHARGALGQVYVALDEELRREVALKEMQEPYAGNAESRARFLAEAEITGQLEHPGIVPVYGLGTHPDGRPYYAMRFIRGESLHEAIVRFHAGRGGKGDPSERALELRGLLGRFVAACNAIAYAHSRGVVHRDIKPSNIMLGPYGETLVVDWGLAKAAGRPVTDDSHEMPIAQAFHRDGIATTLGLAVGTPAFMPPEQALGRMDQVGPASDIYSLGATLYHLLTGELPVSGETAEQILDRVRAGSILPPRRANREVPAALEAVVLKAMAHDPAARYESARELAREVERWLADEPVRAHAEPLGQRAMRWMRRNRPLVAGAAALLLTALVALAAGLWAVGREQSRTARELKRAEENLRLAREAVDKCFILASREPLLQAEKMRPVRVLLLKEALPFYEGFQSQLPDDEQLRAEMGLNHLRVAQILGEIGRKEEALAVYTRAREIFTGLAEKSPENEGYREELAKVWHNMGKIHHDLNRRVEARVAYDAALALRRELAEASPRDADVQLDLASTHNNLGALAQEANEQAEARRHLLKARELALPFAASNPDARRTLGATAHNLGLLLHSDMDIGPAMKAYEEARLAREQLVREAGRFSRPLGDLANTLTHIASLLARQEKHDEAMKAYERAGELLRDALADEYPDFLADLANVDNHIGSLLREQLKSAEARQAYMRAMEVQARLARQHGGGHALELAGTQLNIAHLERDTGDWAESLQWYQLALGAVPGASVQERLLRGRIFAGRAEALAKVSLHTEAAADFDAARALADDRDRLEWHIQAAFCRARAGDHAAAIKDADTLEKGSPSRETLYQLACIASLASAACKGPEADRCATRAMSYLMRAKKAGFFESVEQANHTRGDEDLKLLAGRKEYEEFLAGLPRPKP